jgi:hypothetical protein
MLTLLIGEIRKLVVKRLCKLWDSIQLSLPLITGRKPTIAND